MRLTEALSGSKKRIFVRTDFYRSDTLSLYDANLNDGCKLRHPPNRNTLYGLVSTLKYSSISPIKSKRAH